MAQDTVQALVLAAVYIEAYHKAKAARGELVTGLIYMDKHATDMHANLNTVDAPLNQLGEKELCPGTKGLDVFIAAYR